MKEIKDIVHAFDEAVRANKKTALATVVQVEGSSYRRPGARMLVTEDGQLTGAISGGCLEGDALRKAQLAITQGKNKLVVYDTTDEDDAKLGIQLGCNGIVSILFEPIHPEEPNHPLIILHAAIAARKASVIITGYSVNQGNHIGTCLAKALPLNARPDVQLAIDKAFAEESSSHIELDMEDNRQHFFIAYTKPSVYLVIVGAGNDAMPLVTMAHTLGWEITVVDGRATHATVQRFRLADKRIVQKPMEACKQLEIDNRTAVVLMTHNYNYDLEMLEALADNIPAYIGMLGPASKRSRMLQELEKKGMMLQDVFLEKIHGPTGIDLGAETAEEIALSITAEIMAVMQQKEPTHLRDKQQSIHYRAL